MLHRIIIFYNKIEINQRCLYCSFHVPSKRSIDRQLCIVVPHGFQWSIVGEDRIETIGNNARWLVVGNKRAKLIGGGVVRV